jgi:hypothetical protein
VDDDDGGCVAAVVTVGTFAVFVGSLNAFESCDLRDYEIVD